MNTKIELYFERRYDSVYRLEHVVQEGFTLFRNALPGLDPSSWNSRKAIGRAIHDDVRTLHNNSRMLDVHRIMHSIAKQSDGVIRLDISKHCGVSLVFSTSGTEVRIRILKSALAYKPMQFTARVTLSTNGPVDAYLLNTYWKFAASRMLRGISVEHGGRWQYWDSQSRYEASSRAWAWLEYLATLPAELAA